MHLLDPENMLYLHHLESDNQMRRVTEANTGLKAPRPMVNKIQQVWEQLWAA